VALPLPIYLKSRPQKDMLWAHVDFRNYTPEFFLAGDYKVHGDKHAIRT
jgi:hypothetical protein